MSESKGRIELHCHSCYSERDGVSSIKDIIETSINLGLSGVAITDHMSVSGYPDAEHYSSQHPEVKMIYGMEGNVVDDLDSMYRGDEEFIKAAPTFHVTFLVKNEVGRENLFSLMTTSNFYYMNKEKRQPKIPWSEIEEKRDGLLIGSACAVGQLYYLMIKGASEEELINIAKRFDYIEIQPPESKLFITDGVDDYDEAVKIIQEYDKKLIEIAGKVGVPVVATGDVHFATEEEAQVRSVLQNYLGYSSDEQYNLHILSTEEMLEAFSFVGEEKAYEIVIKNPKDIANQIESFKQFPKTGEFYPELDDAHFRLKSICEEKLHTFFGNDIPQEYLDQLNWELDGLFRSGSDSIILIARELIIESGLTPYEFGCRGTLCGMLTAYLCGITCVDPLTSKLPLYPEFTIGIYGDKYLDVDFNFPEELRDEIKKLCSELEEVGDSFDAGTIRTMSDKAIMDAIECYEIKHEIEFSDDRRKWIEKSLSNVVTGHGKHPGGVVLVPEDYSVSAFTPLINIVGEASSIDFHGIDCLYKFDILTCDHTSMIHRLIQKTGVDVGKISLDDKNIAAMFSSRNILETNLSDGIDAIGVPSFNTQFMSILSQEIGIDSFEDVVKAICLSHGTDVWIGNAQTLLWEERYTKDSILSSREDIFDCLLALGFDREEAFVIAEFVRKGKAAVGHSEKWNDWKVKIEEAGAPDWFIWSCERIRYMFPRAHAYRYALDAWWCAWFKLYYPKEFYEAYFEICASKKLLDVVKEGSEALSLYKKGFYDHVDRIPLEYTEYDEYYTTDFVDTEILLAEEIIARGVVFN